MTTSKASYHHGDLPHTLMRLALDEIAASGTEALSLRALARQAGVSATAPYRHFPSKRCLLAALATEGFTGMQTAMNVAVEAEADVDEQFIALGGAYVRFARENPTAYQLMFGGVIGDFSEYADLLMAAASTYGVVLSVCERVIEHRRLDVTPVELGAVAWAGVHGVASLCIDKPSHGMESGIAPQQSIAFLERDPEQALRLMFGAMVNA